MSMDALIELRHEVRRLFIAGGKLAPGDLKLTKLVPSLRQIGETAPVFARVAQSVERAIGPAEDDGASRLLELAMLLNSISYTQGRTDIGDGEIVPLQGGHDFSYANIGYRKIKPVLDALTQKGPGRLEVLQTAYQEGVFRDFRLLIPAVSALDESYPEIPELLIHAIIPSYGSYALPVLHAKLELDGGKGDSRRLQMIHRLSGYAEIDLYARAAEEGAFEVRLAAIHALGDYSDQEERLLGLAGDRRKEIRRAALASLSRLDTPKAAAKIFEALASKDREIAIEPARQSRDVRLVARIIELADSLKADIKDGRKDEETVGRLQSALEALEGRQTSEMFGLLKSLLNDPAFAIRETSGIQERAVQQLVRLNDPEARKFAVSLKDSHNGNFLSYSFGAALRSLPPEEAFDSFSGFFEQGRKGVVRDLLRVFHDFVSSEDEETAASGSGEKVDSRWIGLFVKTDHINSVSRLIRPQDSNAAAYLADKCKAEPDFTDHDTVRALLALYRIGHKDTPELLMHVLYSGVHGNIYYLNDDQMNALMLLPGAYAEPLPGSRQIS
ncbi:HEAT repeat domain-containing protein [Cohnella faecalis]|uniref:HEAT repeat domain-containing protein n=1 Tax=Cohnella faecalis TaxID=2315694 RepID=A0A398CH14_9BACL|nr:HEAT repeat domain-containing protein [Cohnella faecalis]RIE02496.1 HEAT repeat domain-containing protein [Cohnella faecalis]